MKNLIVYFSYSGNTDRLVKGFNKQFGFDVKRIERKVPYSSDYDTCAYKEAKDEWQNRECPSIKSLDVDYSKYDNILLCFPIWWYTIPMPVATFVKTLAGYMGGVFVFANSYTNDPQYIQNAMQDLKALNGNINFKQVLFNKSVDDHIKFIKNI